VQKVFARLPLTLGGAGCYCSVLAERRQGNGLLMLAAVVLWLCVRIFLYLATYCKLQFLFCIFLKEVVYSGGGGLCILLVVCAGFFDIIYTENVVIFFF